MSIETFKNAVVRWKNVNKILKAKADHSSRAPNFEATISNEEIFAAYTKWRGGHYTGLKDDEVVLRALDIKRSCFAKNARHALFLTANHVAQKLGISPSRFSKLEALEWNGDISINQLRKIADAMDCELTYIVRPRNTELFSERLWRKLLPEALRRFQFRQCSPQNRSGALAAVARELTGDPDFRRTLGWSRNEINGRSPGRRRSDRVYPRPKPNGP